MEVIDAPPFIYPIVLDHTTLPASDGTFAQSFYEHPQSLLLTDSILSVLQRLHPDDQFCIGQDCGIYWNFCLSDQPTRGPISPDWFYVPNVPPLLKGKMRRSYVLWQEIVAPAIVIEFVSGDGSDERDQTPFSGKFWVYEQAIRVPFYAIYEVERANVDVYHLVDGRYELLAPNERGHYFIDPLEVELGIWQGNYGNLTFPWLRWWNAEGVLVTGDERAEQEHQRAEQEHQRAEQEHQRAEQEHQRAEQAEDRAALLAARLRALGIDPNAV